MAFRSLEKNSRLGRGLDSLLGPSPKKSALVFLDIEKIAPGKNQPRKHFEEEDIQELARSIKSHGLLQPILARAVPGEEGAYQIIAGERRWRAAGKAGLHKIPVIIKDPSPKEAAVWSLLENLQRKALNPMEEAHAYRAILEEQGLSQEDLAALLGFSRPALANTLRLLQLDPKVQKMVAAGKISFGQAREILRAKSPAEQRALAEKCVQKGLTVQSLAAQLRRPSSARPGKPAKKPPAWIKEAQSRLERMFFKKIRIDFAGGRGQKNSFWNPSRKSRGQLSFLFESEEDLKDLLERLLRKKQ